jgi:hypothetical protein
LDLRLVVWLSGTYLRLDWTGDLARSCAWLSRTYFRLAWTVGHCAWVGACNARLCCDGTRCCDHCRAALVHVVELLTVAGCFALDLKLGSHWRNAGTAHRRDLSWLGSYGDSASATVIGDPIVDDGRVVDDDRAVVDMGDVDVDAVD